MNFFNRNIYKLATTGDENMIAHWEAVTNDYAKYLSELNLPRNIVDFQSESIYKGVIAVVNTVIEPAREGFDEITTLYVTINYPEPEREYDLRLRYINGRINLPYDCLVKETCLFDEWLEDGNTGRYYHSIATETMEIPIICDGFSFERLYR